MLFRSQPPADLDEVQTILTARHADGYRIELQRCIGKGEDVLVAFRAAGVEKDLDDDRPCSRDERSRSDATGGS